MSDTDIRTISNYDRVMVIYAVRIMKSKDGIARISNKKVADILNISPSTVASIKAKLIVDGVFAQTKEGLIRM